MGSLGVCAALYALMCLVITGMVPTPDIDVDAPFALAFRDRGGAVQDENSLPLLVV
jgi:APA family basic amino acid/polyamine antiporter